MDYQAKKKILESLAQVNTPKAVSAMAKEVDRIELVAASETNYNILTESISLLDTFAYRVYEKAFAVAHALLIRLSHASLTHDEVAYVSEDQIKKYNNNETLIVKVLSLLENIRYHLPDKIFQIFLEYSVHSSDIVKRKALEGLNAISKYHLDIFYGDGKDWPGLRAEPQEKVLDYITALSSEDRWKYFSAIIAICKNLLSPSVTGSKWSYKQVSIRTGVLPATNQIKIVRERAIELLVSLYGLADATSHKRSIISTLQTVTQSSHGGNSSNDIQAMLHQNAMQVLESYEQILVSETDMEIVQQVEHLTYWFHRHSADQNVRKKALNIKVAIDGIPEYQIFKVLIGYEGVFDSWVVPNASTDDSTQAFERDYKRIEELRTKLTMEFAQSINGENFSEWKNRILRYSKIQSNDMATFPFFGKFLEEFSKSSPDLAFELLNDHAQDLGWFTIPILVGLWRTEQIERLRGLLIKWIEEDRHLVHITRVFEISENLDVGLIKMVLERAKSNQDKNVAVLALRQVVGSIVAKFDQIERATMNAMLVDATTSLNILNDGRAFLNIWFRKELSEFISALGEPTLRIILDNLLFASEIDHEAERVLTAIATSHPELVLEYFGKRIKVEIKKDDLEFSAIPFQFYSLQEPLAKHPKLVIQEISRWYENDDNYGMFVFRGGKFLHNIFPTYSEPFANELFEYVHSGDRKKIEIVMAVLKNYQGSAIIHPICLEIVRGLSPGDPYLDEVASLIFNTGVVTGEFGFAEAYERKINELEAWLPDSTEPVRVFITSLQSDLQKAAANDRMRGEEVIKLQKFRYGEEPNV